MIALITTFTTAPANNIFPTDLVDLIVSEGNQTTLTCTARGSPAPVFIWYRGSEVVDIADGRLQISSTEMSNVTTGFIDVTSLLNITQVDRTDFGVFRCEASNTILGVPSNDSQSYNLTVNCKLPFMNDVCCSYSNFLLVGWTHSTCILSPVQFPPQFLRTLFQCLYLPPSHSH